MECTRGDDQVKNDDTGEKSDISNDNNMENISGNEQVKDTTGEERDISDDKNMENTGGNEQVKNDDTVEKSDKGKVMQKKSDTTEYHQVGEDEMILDMR